MAVIGTVVSHLGVAVIVNIDGVEHTIKVPLHSQLVVGDTVELNGSKLIRRARYSLLRRLSPKKGIMEVAANIDALAVVLCAVPKTTRVFLEQAIIAASLDSIRAFIIVTKGDLPENQRLYDDLVVEYQDLLPCFLVSTQSGQGIDQLKRYIAQTGRIILSGVSGAGKSTLTNMLHSGLNLNVGNLSRQRGKHTTSASSLHSLVSGGELIDSPGVRNFAPVNLKAEQLAQYFTGFAPLLRQENCRFRNCLHREEPECVIKKAVLNQRLSTARYELYLQMLMASEK